jgi:hypothetical protein
MGVSEEEGRTENAAKIREFYPEGKREDEILGCGSGACPFSVHW